MAWAELRHFSRFQCFLEEIEKILSSRCPQLILWYFFHLGYSRRSMSNEGWLVRFSAMRDRSQKRGISFHENLIQWYDPRCLAHFIGILKCDNSRE